VTSDWDFERFDEERPAPPPLLYKYVIPPRVDVLENAEIRFTPPLNTNDIFEVRQTFDLVAGPKMVAFFKQLEPQVDIEEPLRKALDELGLTRMTNEQAKALVQETGGGDLEATTRSLLSPMLDRLLSLMNEPEKIDQLLDRIASKHLLLSLTERTDSSPMWAHYAGNSAGFVIAFDTSSEFFRRGEDHERQALHKVKYFDGRVPEMMDDPFSVFVSKQADWAYEREWRLYVDRDQATRVLHVNDDEIHLGSFPRDAVQRVILGMRASDALAEQLDAILTASYPHCELTRMHADRTTASLIELPVG
jgi:hypothetical protein